VRTVGQQGSYCSCNYHKLTAAKYPMDSKQSPPNNPSHNTLPHQLRQRWQ
jgi:hypothetical protein